MVDRGGVSRPVQRPIHDVVALGSVLAAHILNHPNVAALDNYVGGIVVAVEIWSQMGAAGVRVNRMGAPFAPLGKRITVCSFTPSRMGSSRRAYRGKSHRSRARAWPASRLESRGAMNNKAPRSEFSGAGRTSLCINRLYAKNRLACTRKKLAWNERLNNVVEVAGVGQS
jgi:hypothetical protein